MYSFPIHWRTAKRLMPLEALIRQEAGRLFGFYSGLKVRRVDLESIPASEIAPSSVCVTVEARARQRQVFVSRAHEDAGVAVREAFDALFRGFERRQLVDRRRVKPQGAQLRAA